jgi:general secretion pathway protein D
MRARFAIPILLLSAAVMVAGLADAQQRPQIPAPRLPLQPGQLQPAQRALQKQAEERAAEEAAKQVKQGPPAGGGAAGGGGGAGGGDQGALGGPPNVAQFETGLDYRPMPPGAPVTFNLEDADLPDLVRLISQITGKRFILPGKARSIKATVYAPTKVTAAEAYNAFLSILELNGMTVVPSGRYLKIVESAGIENQPIPTYTGGSATPGDDRYVTRMHRVENVSAEDVAQLLSRFKTREGNVTAYAPTNTVIMTDLGSNIRRMLRLVEAIDVGRTGEQIWIEQIHYANATELAARLQEIFPVGQPSGGGGGGAPQQPQPPRPGRAARAAAAQQGATAGATVGSRSGETRITKILPDERTNSLIILATERAYLRILELIRQLDVPLEGEGRIHVHYVQHGDAEEISSTLSSLISGQGGAGAARGAQAGQAAGAGGAAAASGALFEGEIRVVAHKPSNALVITSSLHDYAALRRVIERLDERRRQVFIEAVIMELSVNRSRTLGLSFHGGIAGFPEDGSLALFGANAGPDPPPSSLAFPADQSSLTGLALGVRGPNIPESQQLIGLSIPAFGVVLNALATSGDANILSTPHIIAMDNVEAEITVGENVPLQTNLGLGGLGGGGLGGLGALAGLAGAEGQGAAGLAGLAGLAGGFGGAVPRQDVGTTIRITPHINDADEVRMEIQEEISQAGSSTEGTAGVRSLSKRTAKTELVVRDAQTVVIGGLMRDEVVNNETKVPILGDIPLIGVLFRTNTRITQKTNLLLFLTPYIIRDSSDLRAIFERKMRERQEFIDRFFVFGDHDYDPPVDYSRTRGLVQEIINELGEIAVERELLEALRAQPPPEHVPRPPVGRVEVEVQPGEGDIVIVPDEGDQSGSPQTIEPPPDLPDSVEEVQEE